MMFKIGDLVRCKASSIQRDRYNPLKKFGIIVSIEKECIHSLWGISENLVVVRWMPWNEEQKMSQVFLEYLEKE